jgi:hypothetical protein
MWVVKGVALGFGIFVLGTVTCVVVAVGIAFNRLAQAAKASHFSRVVAGFGLDQPNIRVSIHHPAFWAALILSIVIGLWIMRSRAGA